MIRIKWIYNTVYHPNGMDIYRLESGAADWTKLNSAPLRPLKTLPANNKLNAEASGLFKALADTKFEEFSTAPLRAFVMIEAIYYDELADYIGITYQDNTVQIGKEYQYKVLIAGTNQEIGRSKPFTSAAYSKVAAPEEIRLKRFKKRIEIAWKPDIYRYYAVDIFRKTSEEATFNKITKVPRAIQKDQADKFSDKTVFYEDTNIVYTANYVYRFVAIDYFGQASEMSTEYSVAAGDFVPPALAFNIAPTALSLSAQVRLEWNLIDEKDLAGVNIYSTALPDNPYEKINAEVIPKSLLTYSHTNLATGSHYYKIATVDNAGNETMSAPVFAEIKDLQPPAKPQGLVSSPEEGFISLKWQANTEPDLKGYHVQRSIKSNSKINSSYINITDKPIVENAFTEQLPKNVRNEFVYRIVAIDTNFNRSIPSENTLARMPDVSAPLQPIIKNITSDSSKAVISWLLNVDSDLSGYNLYRGLSGDSIGIEKVNFSLIPAAISSYSDRSIKAGTAYTYFLVAVDTSGNNSSQSPGFSAKTTEARMTSKILIDNKKYNATKGTFSLDWSLEGKDEMKGYVVYRQLSSELPFKPITALITENQVKITIGNKVEGAFQVKGYTTSGKTIQSENFKIENQ